MTLWSVRSNLLTFTDKFQAHLALEKTYFVGTALELKGCHSQGKTMEELLTNTREAIELYLEVQGEGGPYIKEIVGIQKVTLCL